MDCKCRIVSDGTARGTKVLDADGNEIDLRICAIDIHVDPYDVVRATLTVLAPQVELIAHYKTTKSYGNV